MFGIETFEVLIFLRQAAIAIGGAAAFWGSLFLFFARRAEDVNARLSALWQGVAQKLLYLFFPAILSYGALWAIIAINQCVFCVGAHEGISIAETADMLAVITHGQYPLYIALIILALVGLGAFLLKWVFFYRNLAWLYGISFVLISVMLLYPWASLASARENVSSALHGWHSIFTLGSVVLVDYLFIALKNNLRPFLTKIFPLITVGIWAGLGLDFLSSGLVFNEEFFPQDRVLFMQTLIGIIIINGAILSGPLARAIVSYQERMKTDALTPRLSKMVGVSGAISLAGWTSITILDSARAITFSYFELAILYAAFACALFVLRDLAVGLLTNFRMRL